MGKTSALSLAGPVRFLLGVALLSRFYAYGQLAVVPLDQDTVSVSEGPGATIFDIASQQEITSTSCRCGPWPVTSRPPRPRARSWAGTSLSGRRVVNDEDPTGVGQDSPPRSASHDRVAFDRHTGETVKCCDTYTSTSADDRGEEIKDTIGFEGLYFKFPFQTEQKTYQFWDGTLGEAPDIEFQEVESIEGLEVYRFEQTSPRRRSPRSTRPRPYSASTRKVTSPSTASTPTPAPSGSSPRPA